MNSSSNDSKTIEFLCREELYDAIPKPKPATQEIPSWYKNLDNTFGDGDPTVTQCRPFFDALTVGWIIPLPADIQVNADEDGQIEFNWDFPIPLMHRQEQGVTGEDSPYHGSSIFQWLSPWRIKVPDGYSILVTSPMNRYEPRFNVFSGIIDADRGFFNLNSPFIWTRLPYSGTVEVGTPIIQIVPFNREGVISEAVIDVMDEEDLKKAQQEDVVRSEQSDEYKQERWEPTKGGRIVEKR